MMYKSIFNTAVAVSVIAVLCIGCGKGSGKTYTDGQNLQPPETVAPPSAPVPETAVINNDAAAGSTSIDPRLTGGSWWNGKSGGDCTKWSFGADGKMSLEFYCEVYNNDFTAANGQIKFLKKIDVCDEDGCQSVDMPGREYSFSDDGKTLILDKEKFTKGGPVSCCPH